MHGDRLTGPWERTRRGHRPQNRTSYALGKQLGKELEVRFAGADDRRLYGLRGNGGKPWTCRADGDPRRKEKLYSPQKRGPSLRGADRLPREETDKLLTLTGPSDAGR